MDREIYAAVEGILFAFGEPVDLSKLSYALNLDLKRVKFIMGEFIDIYNSTHEGTQVIQLEDSYQITTRPETFKYLIKIAKQPKKFQATQALLEALSIVAFKQPVTKLDIEKIRGVNSDYVVNKLVEYNLIEEAGRSESIGRPILFKTSNDFLRIFGIKNIEELKGMMADIDEEVNL